MPKASNTRINASDKPTTGYRRALTNAAKLVIQDAAKEELKPKIVLRRLTRSQSPVAPPALTQKGIKTANSFIPLAATIEGDKEDQDSDMGDETAKSTKAAPDGSANTNDKDFPPLRPTTPVKVVDEATEIVETPNGKMSFAQAIKSVGRIPKTVPPKAPASPSIAGSDSGLEDLAGSDEDFDMNPRRTDKGKGKVIEGFSPFSSPEPEIPFDKSPKRHREEEDQAHQESSPFTFSRDGSPVNLQFDDKEQTVENDIQEVTDYIFARSESPMVDIEARPKSPDFTNIFRQPDSVYPAGDRARPTERIPPFASLEEHMKATSTMSYSLPPAPSPFATKPRIVRTPPRVGDDDLSETERRDILQAQKNSLDPTFAANSNHQGSNIGATSSHHTLDKEQRPPNPTPSAKRFKPNSPEPQRCSPTPPILKAAAHRQPIHHSTPPQTPLPPHRLQSPPPACQPPVQRHRSLSIDKNAHLHISGDGTRVDAKVQKDDWARDPRSLIIVDLIGERSIAKPARPYIQDTIASIPGCPDFSVGPLVATGGKPTQYFGLLGPKELIRALRRSQYISGDERLITFEQEGTEGRTHLGVIAKLERVFWAPIDDVEEEEDAMVIDGAPPKPRNDNGKAMREQIDQLAGKLIALIRSPDGTAVMTKNINPITNNKPIKAVVDEMLQSLILTPTALSGRRKDIGIEVSLVRPTHAKDSWRDDLRKFIIPRPIITGGYGTGNMIPVLFRCDICGGTDHVTTACELPTYPGWTGPTIGSIAELSAARNIAKEAKGTRYSKPRRDGDGGAREQNGKGNGGRPERERKRR
ncbi:hypothetical protein C8J56DRAFT_1040413 [Mycena floridula]|nr:hypothetical protein C8J56DRAFT_1040413 [Mycena floridula]